MGFYIDESHRNPDHVILQGVQMGLDTLAGREAQAWRGEVHKRHHQGWAKATGGASEARTQKETDKEKDVKNFRLQQRMHLICNVRAGK